MTKDIANMIKEKLKELEQNLIYLKQISYDVNIENLKSDMIRYWGIERGIQISIESVIDIGNIIISVSGKDKPNTYRETMLKLSDIGVVSKDFSEQLANMTGFRNILVHDYTRVDEEIIINILKKDINDFIKYSLEVNKWLKNNDYKGMRSMINSLKDIEIILEEHIANLVEEFNISLIYVFGSFGKGDSTKYSDIDIAFLLNGDIDGYTKLDLLGKLVDIFKREDIDLVVLNKVNEILQFQVIKYGKVIYMDSLYNKVVFESTTMSRYMDMEHFRRTQQEYSHKKFLDVMDS